jgi:exosortase/archaeosortase family protein
VTHLQSLVRWWRARREGSRFAVRLALLIAAFYAALYYPHAAGSVPARLLHGYLESLAWIAGRCLSLVDTQVSVQGVFILGRAPLQIVLDCAALDALALFTASVIAFPADLRRKLAGFVVGSSIIWSFNVLRIVLLYVAGVRWPTLFDLLHEDMMALLLVLVSVACFAVWAALSRHLSVRQAAHVASPV